jgi:hypothetical protein
MPRYGRTTRSFAGGALIRSNTPICALLAGSVRANHAFSSPLNKKTDEKLQKICQRRHEETDLGRTPGSS